MGDIPSEGSGLGSSSTVTVGALHAMYAYKRQLVLAARLAEEACEIEIDTLGSPIGIQDQYIAVYGGLRFMEFGADGTVTAQPIELGARTMRILDENLLLFFTGITRKANGILKEQKQNISQRLAVLNEMKQLTYAACDQLHCGNIDAIGTLLNESWQLKKSLASQVSNGVIDDLYQRAIKAGATGGKITGAGGGGFLMVYCPEGRRDSVRQALSDLQELPFKLGQDGSKVIFNYQP